MTPSESRENYLNTMFSLDEVLYLREIGLAQKYIAGEISIDDIYTQLKDQGV